MTATPSLVSRTASVAAPSGGTSSLSTTAHSFQPSCLSSGRRRWTWLLPSRRWCYRGDSHAAAMLENTLSCCPNAKTGRGRIVERLGAAVAGASRQQQECRECVEEGRRSGWLLDGSAAWGWRLQRVEQQRSKPDDAEATTTERGETLSRANACSRHCLAAQRTLQPGLLQSLALQRRRRCVSIDVAVVVLIVVFQSQNVRSTR